MHKENLFKKNLGIQKNKLNLNKYFEVLKTKKKLNQSMQFILKKKIEFYEKYKEKINSYDGFTNEIKYLHKPVYKFSLFLNTLKQEKDSLNKAFILKFQAILSGIVLNKFNETIKMEDELEKFRQKEISLDIELNGNSFFSDDVVTMQASFLKGIEKIIESSKTYKLAKFFGYNFEELKNLKTFGALMPEVIRKNHFQFVQNYICQMKTQMKRINNEFHTLALTKDEYIFPVKIYLGLSTSSQYDFIYNAALMDIGLRKEKSILFESSGIISGISKSFHEFIKVIGFDIPNENFVLININSLIISLNETLNLNNFWSNENIHLINQTSLFRIPENIEEIVNMISLKHAEERKEERSIVNKNMR